MSNLLAPFDATGNWDELTAAHLLSRAGFGASHADIRRAVADGVDATVKRLTTPQAESPAYRSAEKLLRVAAVDSGNINHLKAWWLYRLTNSANPLVEKMALFWHNHFATSNSKVDSVRFMLDQNDLIRSHALGNFRPLLHGMARDVAMLIWLDSNANRKRHANENFAREVMELFSLGVGNYTEKDIAEAARAFTGWHVREDEFWFNKLQHDGTNKSLFGKTANMNGEHVIDLCLDHDACPRFLAMKLLKRFVSHEPEEAWIDAFAARIRADNYDMRKSMAVLLRSNLFFDPAVRHTLIKSPIDLVIGTFRIMGVRPNLQQARLMLSQLGQDLFEPPTVKGWEGGRLWISSTTILRRANFAAAMTKSNRLGELSDPLELVKEFGWEASAESTVDGFSRLLLGRQVDADTRAELVEFVKSGEGDQSTRLRGLLHLIMTLPEYQLA